jgi:hypothetical protein
VISHHNASGGYGAHGLERFWTRKGPYGFSAEVYRALREKVFTLSKVERDSKGRPILCTCDSTIQNSEEQTPTAAINAAAATRLGWIEFFRSKGYLDSNNDIVWSAHLRAHLSAFAFEHLLGSAGNLAATTLAVGYQASAVDIIGIRAVARVGTSVGNRPPWLASCIVSGIPTLAETLRLHTYLRKGALRWTMFRSDPPPIAEPLQ